MQQSSKVRSDLSAWLGTNTTLLEETKRHVLVEMLSSTRIAYSVADKWLCQQKVPL